jgi:hypothetical protein
MKTSIQLFSWIPRIICILAILFISIFAADAFAPGLTIWQQLRDFFLHLIPSFLLLIILVISWRRELTGGILFMVIGLGMSPFIYTMNYNMNHSVWTSLLVILMITIPFVLVGLLFVVSYSLKRKNSSAS